LITWLAQLPNWCVGLTGFLFRYYVYVHFAWKGHPRNDLYCVGRDGKTYSLTDGLGCVNNLPSFATW